MQIRYKKELGLILFFPVNELKFGLAVLRGIQGVLGLGFIREAIEDIEFDIKQAQIKKLPQINYFHICTKCFCEVDERTENSLSISKNGDVSWTHKTCPQLKHRDV